MMTISNSNSAGNKHAMGGNNAKTTMMIMAIVLMSTFSSTTAWSLGPFAVNTRFLKPPRLSNSASAANVVTASTVISMKDLSRDEASTNAAFMGNDKGMVGATSSSPTSIDIDQDSFVQDHEFRSSTVDLVYQQSLKRAGLQ
eukprot:CAMPEP_0119546218 /NCGR_PEP_ID=MMETSP1352-20130426/728_1 /TAXON_ID=265584 /ORGANISM="Stauroneis constricta, Strain CCMP1120" /LENGTH=141 /DNA_ID=CAMNT_0007590893 /DNA_START=99 /DNA_END=524 /DNA_ORIENTATION=+